MARDRRVGRLLGLGVFVLVIDILSKYLAHSYLPLMEKSSAFYPYGGVGVFSNFLGIEFSLSHTTNTGMVWGLFGQYQIPLLVLRLGLIGAMIGYLLWGKCERVFQWPFVLIIAGALGNVIDFFFYGHVVDMIHFKFWGYDYPVFNIADSSIFIGVAWMILLSLFANSIKHAQKLK